MRNMHVSFHRAIIKYQETIDSKYAIIHWSFYSSERFHSFPSSVISPLYNLHYIFLRFFYQIRVSQHRLDYVNSSRSVSRDLSWTLDRVFDVEGSTLIYSFQDLPLSKEISSTTILLRSRFSSFVLAQRSSLPSRLIALSHGSYCSSTVCTIKYYFSDFPFVHSHYCVRDFFVTLRYIRYQWNYMDFEGNTAEEYYVRGFPSRLEGE